MLEKLISAEACDRLSRRAAELIAQKKDEFDKAVFSTRDQEKTSNDWFLESGDKIRLFMEEEKNPNTTRHRVNKIGHAMHDLDPEFAAFSRQAPLADIAHDIGLQDPVLMQSMYIFKQPFIGGEVRVHQDSTFLFTEPLSCVGFWIAIQDATVENGCLFALPGGQKEPLRERFQRDEKGGTALVKLEASPLPETGYVPLEAPRGTLVLLHGNLPHFSEANRSGVPREAYAVHVVERSADYPASNWLQRGNELALRGFA